MKFALIEEEKSHHPVSLLARVLGVTAAGYHAWRKRAASRRVTEDKRLKELIQEAHERSYCIYGAPRIHRRAGPRSRRRCVSEAGRPAHVGAGAGRGLPAWKAPCDEP
jgi:putative transposase